MLLPLWRPHSPTIFFKNRDDCKTCCLDTSQEFSRVCKTHFEISSSSGSLSENSLEKGVMPKFTGAPLPSHLPQAKQLPVMQAGKGANLAHVQLYTQ